MIDIKQLLQDDGQLDDETLRIIAAVLSRAEDGHTDEELYGYLGYRRRIANHGDDKVRVRRVTKALRTDRWGLRQLVDRVRHVGEDLRREERRGREARQVFYDQIAAANALIPPSKRGRGSGGRRRGRKGDRRWERKHVSGTLV